MILTLSRPRNCAEMKPTAAIIALALAVAAPAVAQNASQIAHVRAG